MNNNGDELLTKVCGSKEIVDFIKPLDYSAISRACKLINTRKLINWHGNPEFNAAFYSWLASSRNEKDIAQRTVFGDIMNAKIVAEAMARFVRKSDKKPPD